jgi:hypothetical protein
MKDEALKLALEALEHHERPAMTHITIENAKLALADATQSAMTSHNSEGDQVICIEPHLWKQLREAIQALAAPVQEPVATVKAKRDGGGTFVHWTKHPVAGMKLYTTPPAQPAPVQPAHISPRQLLALAQEANLGLHKVIEVFRIAAQPAVQGPVALGQEREAFEAWHDSFFVNKGHAAHHRFHDRDGYCIDDIQNQWKGWKERAKRTTPPAEPAVPDAITDDSESPEYRTGWNDCRAEMLKGMKP